MRSLQRGTAISARLDVQCAIDPGVEVLAGVIRFFAGV